MQRRLIAVAVALAALAVVPVPAPAAPHGALLGQPSGGCVTTLGGVCRASAGLDGPAAMAFDPAGDHLYAASFSGHSLTAYAVESDGTLTRVPGTAGCVSDAGAAGECVDGKGLERAHDVAVTDTAVYVAGQGTLAVVSRAPDGTLSQPGTNGCWKGASMAAGYPCTYLDPLDQVKAVAVSPDGDHVYVTSSYVGIGYLHIFDRDAATGALTLKAGTAGCLSSATIAGCTRRLGITSPGDVVFSPDGAHAYVMSTAGEIAEFERNADGTLTPIPGNGCIADANPSCVPGHDLEGVDHAVMTPDGTQVIAGVNSPRRALVVLDRDTTTGALSVRQCYSDHASTTCDRNGPLNDIKDAAISPNGRTVYAASVGVSSALEAFDRTGGLLRRLGGRWACYRDASDDQGPCRRMRPGQNIRAIAAGAEHVYAGSFDDDGIATMRRFTGENQPPTCTNSTAAVDAGKAVLLRIRCTDPDQIDTTWYELTQGPVKGTLPLDWTVENGDFVAAYLAYSSASGTDRLVVRFDDEWDSTLGTITVDVRPAAPTGGGQQPATPPPAAQPTPPPVEPSRPVRPVLPAPLTPTQLSSALGLPAANGTVPVSGGLVVKLGTASCPPACTVQASLTSGGAGARAAAAPVLGTLRLTVAPGARKALAVRLSNAGRRLLARKRRIKAVLTVVATDHLGRRTTVRRSVVLTAGKRRRR